MHTRIVAFIFALAGVLVTAIGAWITAQAVIIDQHMGLASRV